MTTTLLRQCPRCAGDLDTHALMRAFRLCTRCCDEIITLQAALDRRIARDAEGGRSLDGPETFPANEDASPGFGSFNSDRKDPTDD